MVSSVIANCTGPNVKIRNYRSLKADGSVISITVLCSAILQAINDKVNVINCSFLAPGKYELMETVVKHAYDNGILIVAGAGNTPNNLEVNNSTALNASKYTITAGSHNKINVPSAFTGYGTPLDVLAPGEEIVAYNLNNAITITSGTSFSTPFTVSVYAMFFATHFSMPFETRFRAIESAGDDIEQEYTTNCFGSGIINPLNLFSLNIVKEPQFNIKEGKYIGEISVEIKAEEGTDIYYTTDQSYPSPRNGILYTEPITIYDAELDIRAVAYKDNRRSNYVYNVYYSYSLGTDNMFTVTSDGIITNYVGNVQYLKIPEVINGITVKEIAFSSGFDVAELYGVILPDTVEYLGWTVGHYDRLIESDDEQLGAFEGNKTLNFIEGNGIKVIGYYGVSNINNLYTVNFPNCEVIMSAGFFQTGLVGATFPKVLKIDNEAFYNNTRLMEIYLPKCSEIGYSAFHECNSLGIISSPNFNYMANQEFCDNEFSTSDYDATKEMFYHCHNLTECNLPNLETIGKDFFYLTTIKDVYLSSIQYVYDLPNTIWINDSYYGPYYQPVPVSLSFPSTLQYCVPATDYKNEYIEYAVYGTSGTYAEQWAAENSIPFYEISQETAIREDIDTYWDKYSWQPLEFDARGFNRTYQWYGSTDDIIGNDTPIIGATDKNFNPDDNKQYPYYYCVMNSKDVDVDGNIVSEVNITSDICQNRLYYIYDVENTTIDYENLIIYTNRTGKQTVEDIVGIPETTTFYYRPSYIYLTHWFYGTGSYFILYNEDNTQDYYTIIVQGDVNGDSAVDVLDALDVQKASTGKKELTGNYHTAADTDLDGEISVHDYTQVVNMVVNNN